MLRYVDCLYNRIFHSNLMTSLLPSFALRRSSGKRGREELRGGMCEETIAPRAHVSCCKDERWMSEAPPCGQRRVRYGGHALSSSSSAAIADLQGYYMNGCFVIKSLTVMKIRNAQTDEEKCQTYIFRAPCPISELNRKDNRTRQWIERHHRASPPWNSGTYDYDKRNDIIRQAFDGVSKIFVKGHEKSVWLRKRVNCFVVDLHMFGCPPLKECVNRTLFRFAPHSFGVEGMGAQHVIAIYEWMTSQRPDLFHKHPVRR